MKVINFFAGPSTGKSTYSAMLFSLLKQKGINCELVNEYAKQLVWSGRQKDFAHQFYISSKQTYKMEILKNQVDYIVSDSPILLGLIYRPDNYFPSYDSLLKEIHNSYDNINIMLTRKKKYNPVGRNQTEEEAKDLDYKIWEMLIKNNIPFHTVEGDNNAPYKILELLDFNLQEFEKL